MGACPARVRVGVDMRLGQGVADRPSVARPAVVAGLDVGTDVVVVEVGVVAVVAGACEGATAASCAAVAAETRGPSWGDHPCEGACHRSREKAAAFQDHPCEAA